MDEQPKQIRQPPQISIIVVAMIALPLALIALIPSLIGIHMVQRQADQNKARIVEIQMLRVEGSKAGRVAELKLCRAINTITRRDRATISASAKESLPILKRLGFTPAQITIYLQASRAQARREIRRRPLIEHGNCLKLPNPRRAAH